ncbi:MAG: RND family transporter, partial [Candidatus Binatia bacterium]
MFFSLVVRHRFVVIAAFLAVTAFFAFQLPDLRMEPDTEAYVPMHHPARRFWRRAEEDFGLGREILVAIEASGPRGIFTPEVLSGIADLSAKLQALEGVEEGQVTSLAEAEAIVGTADGLEVVPFFSESPSTQTEADAIRERVYQNPMFLNRLVSRDGSIGVILVTSQHFSGEDPLVIYERVASVVEGYSIEGCRLLLAGNVAVEAVFGTQMAEDLARLIPLALFVVVVVLFFCFRSISMGDLLWRSAAACILLVAWNVVGSRPLAPGPLVLAGLAMAMLTVRGVMLPCLVVVIAVTWTWGFQALLDLPIYIAGTLVPPLLLAIGCADGIHIIERYHENSEFGEDPGEIVVRTMEELWRPVVLTSVTTAAGFGALVAGRMTVYQVFGLTTSVGIVAAMFASLTVLPALLSLMPLPLRHLAGYSESLVPRILIRVGELTERYRVATVSAAILIVVLGLVSASRLRVDYSWVESLQEGTPVLEADRILRTRHGGTSPMNIIISA